MVRLSAKRSDTKFNVKLGGFRPQLQASYVSSHTEELWYNETVGLSVDDDIYTYIWFSFDHWRDTPWFFSRSRTRLVFSFFFTQKTFFFFLWAMIQDIFISCSWPGFFFCFFLVPWILVDIRLVNTYIHIYIGAWVFFSTGIITDTRTYIIHRNKADSL